MDVLLIDGNTGTQLDVPPHSVVRPELKREKSGPFGLSYTDKIEAWQFGGEACVVDVRDLLDQTANGVSPLILPSHVEQFEQQHRRLKFGDVVLFRSDYSDKYYRPFPDGHLYHRLWLRSRRLSGYSVVAKVVKTFGHIICGLPKLLTSFATVSGQTPGPCQQFFDRAP
jgi:hypothetical protein